MIKIGMIIGDRYEILEKIGTGGMSDVYKAKDSKLNRFVAVKVLKQEFSENANFVSKFRTEAQAAAGMMHPNIVNVYDVGEEGGIYYIVMELVEGITLKKYIEKKSRLSIKETISIAIQVSMGIEAAHNNHIIHRDIKPQNIMISKEGKVKVTDFGIAKAVSSNTITSNVMGSVHYTSPEQARGGFSDEKSDIYSLGITMFEMLTGRVPFNGETTVAIAIKHIQDPMPSPREYVPEIPISVEQIVYKCTQKSPDRRYQNMAELIEDLKKSLMKPDEDFVKMVDPDEEAATRWANTDEIRQINEQLRGSNTGEIVHMRTNNSPSASKNAGNRTGSMKAGGNKNGSKNSGKNTKQGSKQGSKPSSKNQPKSQPKNSRPAQNKPTKRPATIDDRKKKTSSTEVQDEKMEKITTVCAVIAAVVVGIVVIFLIGKYAFGMFDFGKTPDDGAEDILVDATATPGVTEEAAPSNDDDPDMIPVPDVTNLSYAEAVATLNKVGFQVEKADMSSESVQKDNIVTQSPSAKEKAKRGSTVTVSVSTGGEIVEVKVPNIVGLDENAAKAKLIEAGLQPGMISETTNPDTNLIKKVCYQSYAEGVTVNSGTKVDIKVSTGTGEVFYSFISNIESPSSEDSSYDPNSSATVILTTASGQELKRENVTSFPVSMNITGITGASEGTVTIVYTVTTPDTTTTDEDGNTLTVSGGTEERSVRRTVKFTQE